MNHKGPRHLRGTGPGRGPLEGVDVTDSTYTNRRTEPWTIASKDRSSIGATSGWHVGLPEPVAARVEVGQTYTVEFIGTQITGIVIDGEWAFRKSDQDLERERQEFRERMNREHEELLLQHRDEWRRREKALPVPLRQRLIHFREKGGRTFDRDGWGYELVVCELAALYQASSGEDTEEIDAYGCENGTSGNQHDYAKALAKMLDSEPEKVGQTVSALTPITGDPYYAGTRS